MSLLLETVKLQNRRFPYIFYHNLRLNKARKELFACTDVIDIAAQVSISGDIGDGIYKCSIIYNKDIVKVSFELYKRREIKKLKIIDADEIDYSYKYADRSVLNNYLSLKGDCDEVLLIKNGMVTDTSFSNIAFFDGVKWITPKTPLLKGTKREKLIAEGLIMVEDIKAGDLKKFEKASLINCMLDLEDTVIDRENFVN